MNMKIPHASRSLTSSKKIMKQSYPMMGEKRQRTSVENDALLSHFRVSRYAGKVPRRVMKVH